MLAKVMSYGLWGLGAYPVEIEVDVSNGLPYVTLVGLADAAIKESKARVKAAIKNAGFSWPDERITINLAPSDVKKEGAGFDLSIALGILAASRQLNYEKLKEYYFLGELSLDGGLRPCRGILPIGLAVAKEICKNLVIPAPNAREAGFLSEVSVYPIATLTQAVALLDTPSPFPPLRLEAPAAWQDLASYTIDFSEVKGQYHAKRALEVAVAGGHNVAMIGPPGSGKTMLAQRIPTIMPGITQEESLEVTRIHSVLGTLPARDGIMATRPFRSPHHNISAVALAGGGSPPQPGEITLAHHGVLFLDELPEFHRDCLEALRQPLEEGQIRVSRIKRSVVFPAACMLVVALNPCPCGYFTDPRRACRCSSTQIHRYIGKISGPLLDRIDIHIELPAVKYKELSDTDDAEPSCAVKARVTQARALQQERFLHEGIFCNARMGPALIKRHCALGQDAKGLLRMAMTELGLSARAYDKILKVSRTIADIGGAEQIAAEHISEAIQYRSLDRQW